MGRHGAEQDDAQQRVDAADVRFDSLGPVTDPLLLDAVPVRAQRGSSRSDPPRDDGRAAPRRAPADGRRPAAPSPAPWAPKPVTRQIDTPFSGPIVLPDPDEPVAGPPASRFEPPALAPRGPAGGTAPRGLVDRPSAPPAAAPSRTSSPTQTLEPDARRAAAGPHEEPSARPGTPPDAAASMEDEPDADEEPVPVGLSLRTLLLSLGVGVAVAVALSVTAVLPL